MGTLLLQAVVMKFFQRFFKNTQELRGDELVRSIERSARRVERGNLRDQLVLIERLIELAPEVLESIPQDVWRDWQGSDHPVLTPITELVPRQKRALPA